MDDIMRPTIACTTIRLRRTIIMKVPNCNQIALEPDGFHEIQKREYEEERLTFNLTRDIS
jgi:hypothetical protein